MKQLRTMRDRTKQKYYLVIQDCVNASKFNIEAMRAKHNVSTVLFQAMLECQCIARNNNECKWIGGPINEPMLNKIYACYERINRKHHAAELLRKSNVNPKKVIAKPQHPISKPQPAQVIEPTPLNKAYVPLQHVAEIHADKRALRNAFITGVVIGVLISCAVAAMW